MVHPRSRTTDALVDLQYADIFEPIAQTQLPRSGDGRLTLRVGIDSETVTAGCIDVQLRLDSGGLQHDDRGPSTALAGLYARVGCLLSGLIL